MNAAHGLWRLLFGSRRSPTIGGASHSEHRGAAHAAAYDTQAHSHRAYQAPADRGQHANMVRATCNMVRATCDKQHATWILQRATCSVPCSVDRGREMPPSVAPARAPRMPSQPLSAAPVSTAALAHVLNGAPCADSDSARTHAPASCPLTCPSDQRTGSADGRPLPCLGPEVCPRENTASGTGAKP